MVLGARDSDDSFLDGLNPKSFKTFYNQRIFSCRQVRTEIQPPRGSRVVFQRAQISRPPAPPARPEQQLDRSPFTSFPSFIPNGEILDDLKLTEGRNALRKAAMCILALAAALWGLRHGPLRLQGRLPASVSTLSLLSLLCLLPRFWTRRRIFDGDILPALRLAVHPVLERREREIR